MKQKIYFILLSLLFCRLETLVAQEWFYMLETDPTADRYFDFYDSKELSNGSIAVSSELYYYRSGAYNDFYSAHPAVTLISPNGVELARNSFLREGYTTMSYGPYLFENNGYLFALSTYSPEHDYTCPNYFMNYDNPPTDAKLVLSKLDEGLNLLESYEHSFPIDTFENRGDMQWEFLPNEYSGNVFLFSAFEDEGNIVGAYFKTVSADFDNPRGHDTLFFFRMNFNGEMINLKGYERPSQGDWHQAFYRRNQIVKTESHYILYERYDETHKHGRVLYYDKEFNHVATKYIKHPDYNNPIIDPHPLMDVSVVKCSDNITYLSTTVTCVNNPHSYEYYDVRLYKLDDNLENSSEFLPIEDYIIRGFANTYEISPNMRAVDIAPNNSLYFACNYDCPTKGNSVLNPNNRLNIAHNSDLELYPDKSSTWAQIEYLNKDLDTISTYFYKHGISSIEPTNDGGLLVVNGQSISRFPPEAFLSIEEAHAHNLHLAVAYPNPGGDVLNIRTGLRNATLQVYDMQGRIIHQQIITDEVTSIDASKWNSGTYIWKLTVNNEQLTVEEGKWVK